MVKLKVTCFMLLFLFVSLGNCFEAIDLGGNWNVYEKNFNFTGRVPGGIYTDLMENSIISDIFYGFGDIETRWVSKNNWTYSRTFHINQTILDSDNLNLVFEGIDTFSEIILNNRIVGTTDNMFVRYVFDIKDELKAGENELTVKFTSPVHKSAELFEIQAAKYVVPPECVPEEYQGECHVNHIRKMQASFSWDWGPAFPSMGIWKPVYIEAFNSAVIRDITVNIASNTENDTWDLHVTTYLEKNMMGDAVGTLTVRLETDMDNVIQIYHIDETDTKSDQILHNARFSVPKSHVQLWWPNGYGNAALYQMKVTFISQWSESYVKRFKIGFRTIELVQEQINDIETTDGLSFYFVVNNVPIFAKGTNSIPINILPEKGQDPETIKFLLKSAKDVHMNMIRVWGGGVYESDEFYNIADELGIMIWQDFMFACAMYPTNEEFLATVKEEVKHQVRRLQHHASVILWAANNENEAALRQNWYGTADNFQLYADDFVELYVDTIRTEVLKSDTSRQFLTSSPTNGLQSELEGFIAANPASSMFGDVHYYNYVADSWNQDIYPIPRFSSEYGLQSLPSLSTILTVTNNTKQDLQAFLEHRQHHPGGNGEMIMLISERLPLPDTNKDNFFKTFVFYSQIHQAMAIKLQTEKYRIWRSKLNTAQQGLTMGALYWQLNDVWVAPTWAGIDFNNNWKMLHHFAKKFFSPVLITGYLNSSGSLSIHVVSDLLTNIYNATASISVYRWNSTTVLNREEIPVNILSGITTDLKAFWVDQYLTNFDCGDALSSKFNCFVHLSLKDHQNKAISPDNFVFPAALKDCHLPRPNIKVKSVRQVDEDGLLFAVDIETDAIATFVWLESNEVRGIFSENGFLQIPNLKTVTFEAQAKTTADILTSSMNITNTMDIQYA